MAYRRVVSLDPIVSLAVALAEAPGACACLLGAGVSVDAGVPTAWDIRQDGLRRLYRLETGGDDVPESERLEGWLGEHGHERLGYASLLDLIAPDPAIRRDLLAGYFQDAQPGPAHERLADLAAAGIVRVFVTTNFDRLLERALATRGIDPVIVSDDATLRAAPRREHVPVFIVKAHGDMLQETIRNTRAELAELPPGLADELRAIFDHHGLLVIGWSGRDPALAEIVRGRSPSRYGAWWLSRTEEPADPARSLIEAIGARLIVRPGAADLLGELERRLAVYRVHETGDDPGSVHDETLVLVRRGNEVELDEMLRRERHEFESAVETVRGEFAGRTAAEDVREGWARLSPATDRRLGSLVPLALYRPDLLRREIEGHVAWASSVPPLSGVNAWIEGWHFPFWIIGMTLGGLAVRLDRYAAIKPLLSATWTDGSGYSYPLVGPPGELGRVVAANFGPSPPGGQTWLFPEWQWLLADLEDKDWLVSRYPEWLRRPGEPQRALVELSMLVNIATGLRDERRMAAWWSLDSGVSERYAERLARDATARAAAAEAVGTTLDVFDERAADILGSTQGLGTFPRTERTAALLRIESEADG